MIDSAAYLLIMQPPIMINEKMKKPFASIISPVFNADHYIDRLIESLLRQDYPKERMEIIIVDNNSTDRTKEIIQNYPVVLLEANDIQSSYVARNVGFQASRGEIIAFIDADCQATEQWLTEGVMALQAESADLAGGKVEFDFSQKKSAAEMLDSLVHMHMESQIRDKKSAATANLFVKRSVFEKIGLFPAVVSGGDSTWTRKASLSDFRLIYAPKAIVKHPTRGMKELLIKRFRTGTGSIANWRANGKTRHQMSLMIFRSFFPRRLSRFRAMVKERGSQEIKRKLLRLWLISYLCNLAGICGIIKSLLGNNKKRNRKSNV